MNMGGYGDITRDSGFARMGENSVELSKETKYIAELSNQWVHPKTLHNTDTNRATLMTKNRESPPSPAQTVTPADAERRARVHRRMRTRNGTAVIIMHQHESLKIVKASGGPGVWPAHPCGGRRRRCSAHPDMKSRMRHCTLRIPHMHACTVTNNSSKGIEQSLVKKLITTFLLHHRTDSIVRRGSTHGGGQRRLIKIAIVVTLILVSNTDPDIDLVLYSDVSSIVLLSYSLTFPFLSLSSSLLIQIYK
ncbi:hypothetical protein EVAR_10394_1 [Eumeta japonica]|uniref:Uncharacterized protein n=1 Tax=Eumeta variegata TaxID=151549 RepID=A0A4C1UDG4_EUMVA|nr:hypothetical protein EVAR_10394_1 [Eumeta japonica]